MKCLPTAKVVDTCPGCHRPVVIDLPVKGTHTAASVTSPVVYSILHGHSLKDLAHIEKLAEILRITEILGKIIQDLSVSCRIFLVVLHHPGKNIPIFLFRKALHSFQARKRLEAKLRAETKIMLLIICKRLLTMPYIPVVTVSSVLIVRIIKAASGAWGRLPEKGLAVCRPHCFRNHILKHFYVVRTEIFRLTLYLRPVIPGRLHLIVSAPQAKGCMMTETFYIFRDLLRDIIFKFFCKIINITCEHQILPYDQSHLITKIIEMIRRIITAVPHTDTVKIGTFAGFQKILLDLRCDPGIDAVLRNIISPHGKNFHAIDTERELFSPEIFFLADGKGTETDALRYGFQNCAILVQKFHLNFI